jgi:hypothetical protein
LPLIFQIILILIGELEVMGKTQHAWSGLAVSTFIQSFVGAPLKRDVDC